MNISRNNQTFTGLMKTLVAGIRAKNDEQINQALNTFQTNGIVVSYRQELDEIHCAVTGVPTIRFKAKEFESC